MKVIVKNARLAFPNLFEPKLNEKGKGKYGAAFILPKNHPDLPKLRAAIDEVGKAKWGAKWPLMKKQMEAGDCLLIHDGNAKASLAGYEDNLYFNAYNDVRPAVKDRDTTPLVASDGKPYSGCYVHAIIDLWVQDNKYGKKINAQIQGVQFYKDGEAFAGGGKAASDSDFEPIEDATDEELV